MQCEYLQPANGLQTLEALSSHPRLLHLQGEVESQSQEIKQCLHFDLAAIVGDCAIHFLQFATNDLHALKRHAIYNRVATDHGKKRHTAIWSHGYSGRRHRLMSSARIGGVLSLFYAEASTWQPEPSPTPWVLTYGQ